MVIFLSSVHGFLNLNSRERIIRNYIGLLIYTGYKLFYRQMIFGSSQEFVGKKEAIKLDRRKVARSFRSDWWEAAVFSRLMCGGSPGSRSEGAGEQRRGQVSLADKS
jgi:hypothetical protein